VIKLLVSEGKAKNVPYKGKEATIWKTKKKRKTSQTEEKKQQITKRRRKKNC
jgi:hypothetical protein